MPPSKRLPRYLAFIYTLMKPLQYLRDRYLGDYLYGATYPYWATATAYILEERILFYNNCVLECIVPHTSGGTIDLTKFKVIQQFKGGVFERLNYNDQKMVFEAVLNKYFDYYAVPGQPIYITRVPLEAPGFYVSSREDLCSSVTNRQDKQFYFVSSTDYYTYSTTSFIIYVKLAQYNALAATNPEREAIVRSVADIVNSAGFYYQVATY